MHVFEEQKNKLKQAHVKYWFGYPDEEFAADDGSFTACYCGGRIVPMQKDKEGNTTVGAIWHLRRFTLNDLDERE